MMSGKRKIANVASDNVEETQSDSVNNDVPVARKKRKYTKRNSKEPKDGFQDTADLGNLPPEEIEIRRREADAIRKRAKRQLMSEEERRQSLAHENERKRFQRLLPSFDGQRVKEATRKRMKRASMDEEERRAFRKKDAERKRKARQLRKMQIANGEVPRAPNNRAKIAKTLETTNNSPIKMPYIAPVVGPPKKRGRKKKCESIQPDNTKKNKKAVDGASQDKAADIEHEIEELMNMIAPTEEPDLQEYLNIIPAEKPALEEYLSIITPAEIEEEFIETKVFEVHEIDECLKIIPLAEDKASTTEVFKENVIQECLNRFPTTEVTETASETQVVKKPLEGEYTDIIASTAEVVDLKQLNTVMLIKNELFDEVVIEPQSSEIVPPLLGDINHIILDESNMQIVRVDNSLVPFNSSFPEDFQEELRLPFDNAPITTLAEMGSMEIVKATNDVVDIDKMIEAGLLGALQTVGDKVPKDLELFDDLVVRDPHLSHDTQLIATRNIARIFKTVTITEVSDNDYEDTSDVSAQYHTLYNDLRQTFYKTNEGYRSSSTSCCSENSWGSSNQSFDENSVQYKMLAHLARPAESLAPVDINLEPTQSTYKKVRVLLKKLKEDSSRPSTSKCKENHRRKSSAKRLAMFGLRGFVLPKDKVSDEDYDTESLQYNIDEDGFRGFSETEPDIVHYDWAIRNVWIPLHQNEERIVSEIVDRVDETMTSLPKQLVEHVEKAVSEKVENVKRGASKIGDLTTSIFKKPLKQEILENEGNSIMNDLTKIDTSISHATLAETNGGYDHKHDNCVKPSLSQVSFEKWLVGVLNTATKTEEKVVNEEPSLAGEIEGQKSSLQEKEMEKETERQDEFSSNDSGLQDESFDSTRKEFCLQEVSSVEEHLKQPAETADFVDFETLIKANHIKEVSQVSLKESAIEKKPIAEVQENVESTKKDLTLETLAGEALHRKSSLTVAADDDISRQKATTADDREIAKIPQSDQQLHKAGIMSQDEVSGANGVTAIRKKKYVEKKVIDSDKSEHVLIEPWHVNIDTSAASVKDSKKKTCTRELSYSSSENVAVNGTDKHKKLTKSLKWKIKKEYMKISEKLKTAIAKGGPPDKNYNKKAYKLQMELKNLQKQINKPSRICRTLPSPKSAKTSAMPLKKRLDSDAIALYLEKVPKRVTQLFDESVNSPCRPNSKASKRHSDDDVDDAHGSRVALYKSDNGYTDSEKVPADHKANRLRICKKSRQLRNSRVHINLHNVFCESSSGKKYMQNSDLGFLIN